MSWRLDVLQDCVAPLKGDLSGYWSRRIDDEHRLLYRAEDKQVKILKARYHYSDLAMDGLV